MLITERVFQGILEKLVDGATIKTVLSEQKINTYDFYKYLYENPFHLAQFEAAQTFKADIFVEDTIDIADNEPDASKAKNRIFARHWYASKIRPARYGERIDINVTKTIDIKQALSDAKQRVIDVNATHLRPMCDLESNPKNQNIDINSDLNSGNTGYKPVTPPQNDEDIFE